MSEATPITVKVIVVVSPATMARGRLRPPVELAASSAGRTGSTHGVRPVPAPAMSENARRSSIDRARRPTAGYDPG